MDEHTGRGSDPRTPAQGVRSPSRGTTPADQPAIDPLDEAPETTPRGAGVLVVVAAVLAGLSFLPTGLSLVLGPLGMGCGLVAHLKGRRAGFTAAVVAGVGTVAGLSLRALLDLY